MIYMKQLVIYLPDKFKLLRTLWGYTILFQLQVGIKIRIVIVCVSGRYGQDLLFFPHPVLPPLKHFPLQ